MATSYTHPIESNIYHANRDECCSIEHARPSFHDTITICDHLIEHYDTRQPRNFDSSYWHCYDHRNKSDSRHLLSRVFKKCQSWLKTDNVSHVLSRWRRFLPMLTVGTIYILLGVMFMLYAKDILPSLERLGHWLRQQSVWCLCIVVALIALTGFPFVPGYGTLVAFSGFVYGTILGFVVAFSGALLGACISFSICRRFARSFTARLVASSPHLMAVLTTIERRGWLLLVLVRLAPYPYNLLNALLSATNVSFRVFAGATAASLIKLVIHVALGANLVSLVDKLHHPSAGNIAAGVLGVVTGIGVTFYLYKLARRMIAEGGIELADLSSQAHTCTNQRRSIFVESNFAQESTAYSMLYPSQSAVHCYEPLWSAQGYANDRPLTPSTSYLLESTSTVIDADTPTSHAAMQMNKLENEQGQS